MTQHGHIVANTTGKEVQTTKQRSETRSVCVRDSHHHGLPVVGVAQPCCLARTGMGLILLPICIFLSWPSVFLCDFSVCAVNSPLKKDVFGCQKESIPFTYHSPSSFSLSLDQRERGRGEDYKDLMSGLRSKDSSPFLIEHFFFFSSLFSILDSCFVVLI